MAPIRDTLNPPTPPTIVAVPVQPDLVRPSAATLLTLVILAGLLYVGREIFMPLAVAILLTFTLAPIVNFLRKWSVPKIPAVILTVAIAFAVIGLFSFIIASQVTNLAQNLSTYQSNIVHKVQSLKEMGAEGGVIDRIIHTVDRIGAEIERKTPAPATRRPASANAPPEASAELPSEAPSEARAGDAPGANVALGASDVRAAQPAGTKPNPVPVEIINRESPIDTLKNVIVPLLSPFATAGLIVVVVIFMLLEREELRDRFIRLVGAGDLHKTTEALQDAGERVGHYLLMQLVVNILYAIPIGIGLWLLGIPNAMLWGLLTLVLRFVPYIGPVIGMMIPLFLAVAVSPGWSLLLWTAALFIVVELISNNVIEPWLYGSRTGLSAMAIIVAAIVWTSLWGPVGLVLSTPITVCMMVLGRHVPQFAFLDVLLGNKPVLEPHQRLYQRLLSGDPHEATDNAEEFLEQRYLVEYYEQIGLPALRMGEADRQRGVLDEEQRTRFAATAQTLVANLTDIALEEEEENDEGEDAPADAAKEGEGDGVIAKIIGAGKRMVNEDADKDGEPDAEAAALVLPDGEGQRLLTIGGRGELDDVAAAMLAQTLEVQGAETSIASHDDLAGFGPIDLPVAEFQTVVLTYLNVSSAAHARHTVRRLKRMRPQLRVGVFVPLEEGAPPLPFNATAVYADFVATSLRDAVTLALRPPPAETEVSRRLFTRHVARPLRAPRATPQPELASAT